uniref:Odorant binding protein 15 n=1 Tax=Liriomyza sativae TaxID=127406 RepID=A0A0X8B0A6_LIRSA|nr:odorant binding protein 15 [Liriomyza sativae]
MKVTALIVLACFALANADEWQPVNPERFPEIHNICNKKSPLTEENIEKIYVKFEFNNEPSVREYILCTVTEMKTFCEHDGFHAERVAQQFPNHKEEVAKHVTECNDKNEQKSPLDEWCYREHQCIFSGPVGNLMKEQILKTLKRPDIQ